MQANLSNALIACSFCLSLCLAAHPLLEPFGFAFWTLAVLAALAFFHGRSLLADVSADNVFGRDDEDDSSVDTCVLILSTV